MKRLMIGPVTVALAAASACGTAEDPANNALGTEPNAVAGAQTALVGNELGNAGASEDAADEPAANQAARSSNQASTTSTDRPERVPPRPAPPRPEPAPPPDPHAGHDMKQMNSN